MSRRALGLLACLVVLGMGSLGLAGCGSNDGTVVDGSGDGTDIVGPSDSTATPEGDEVVPPAPVSEDCSTVEDEDGDGAGDCLDTDCAGDPACLPPPAVAEGDCADGVDGDLDGDLDCLDADCTGDAACPPAPAVPEDCSAAGDEDGDGDSNCSDSDCTGDPACSGGDSGDLEINPDILDKYLVEKKPWWKGPGPQCLSCPDEVGNYQDYVTNPAIEQEFGF